MIITVNSESQVINAYEQIKQMFDKFKFVRVKVEKESRTLAQNRWQFEAYKMLALQGDMTANEYRNYCKYHFGCAIRAVEDAEFGNLLRSMFERLTYEQRLASMAFIDVTSTFNVGQMTDYINEIINHFNDKQLPTKQF